VGTTAKVAGVGFAKDEEGIELLYYVNGNYETVAETIKADEDGSWERSIQIPSSAKGSHKIDAQGDSSTLGQVKDATFRVTAGISLSALSGSVGATVVITGNGFAANDRDITIFLAGKEVNPETRVDADANGHWDKVFKVPEMPKGTYTVTAEGEWTKGIAALGFKIEPGLVLSPNQGHVGTNVTVTGGGFAASKGVDIMYDGSPVETTGTSSTGSFAVTFAVPESQHGGRPVTAEVDGEVETTAIFTMESKAPDPPELISPAEGARVGLIGKVTPRFEWSEAPDESGVRYSLQIAASDNVTAAGEFAESIVSVPEIVGTNYTLNATAALSYGTYYWIVQAVDRAGNAGNWTAASSFQAGLLPLRAFIAIIVAIVALIGTLLYFFVIRKRIYYY
jgi:hypothetical protein